MAVYSCDKWTFKSNYRSSLVRHFRNIHGEDRLPSNLPLETYSEPVKQPTKQGLIELPKRREYYPKQNDSELAHYLIEEKQRAAEKRNKQNVGFIVTISLLGLAFGLYLFRKEFYNAIKDLLQVGNKPLTQSQPEHIETNEMAVPKVQIIPRQSQSHDLRENEILH